MKSSTWMWLTMRRMCICVREVLLWNYVTDTDSPFRVFCGMNMYLMSYFCGAMMLWPGFS